MNADMNPLSRLSTPDPESDLDWLAFQYLAGELSPADAAAFEDRLACDRHACEAVARMMQTVDALAVAVPAVAPRSSALSRPATSAPSRRPVLALVSTACLIAVGLFLMQSAQDPGPAPRGGDRRVHELVSLWAETAVDADAPEAERSVDTDDSDLSVPGWMMSAVEYEAREGEPEMEEN